MTELKNAMVFPRDQAFEIGSIAVFCCLVPAGQKNITMDLDGHSVNANITMISSQIYAMTVQLNQASMRSCTNVYCNADGKRGEGSCAYIGCKYDRNL